MLVWCGRRQCSQLRSQRLVCLALLAGARAHAGWRRGEEKRGNEIEIDWVSARSTKSVVSENAAAIDSDFRSLLMLLGTRGMLASPHRCNLRCSLLLQRGRTRTPRRWVGSEAQEILIAADRRTIESCVLAAVVCRCCCSQRRRDAQIPRRTRVVSSSSGARGKP